MSLSLKSPLIISSLYEGQEVTCCIKPPVIVYNNGLIGHPFPSYYPTIDRILLKYEGTTPSKVAQNWKPCQYLLRFFANTRYHARLAIYHLKVTRLLEL